MTNPPRKRRFSLDALRILNDARADPAYPMLSAKTDGQMLLAFLERFDALGWIPPLSQEMRRVLSQFGVIMHLVSDNLCFYEFCSKGARGERDPWLTIFFHVDDATGSVRICGVQTTGQVERRRELILASIAIRVQRLDRWLKRRRKET